MDWENEPDNVKRLSRKRLFGLGVITGKDSRNSEVANLVAALDYAKLGLRNLRDTASLRQPYPKLIDEFLAEIAKLEAGDGRNT